MTCAITGPLLLIIARTIARIRIMGVCPYRSTSEACSPQYRKAKQDTCVSMLASHALSGTYKCASLSHQRRKQYWFIFKRMQRLLECGVDFKLFQKACRHRVSPSLLCPCCNNPERVNLYRSLVSKSAKSNALSRYKPLLSYICLVLLLLFSSRVR